VKAVLYARVSTEEQLDNWSVQAQTRTFQEYCIQKGWTCVGIYKEEGKSARSDSIDKRPQFRKLLDDCKKREFDIIVVHSLDRWSRNLSVTLQSFKQLADQGIFFCSITENIDYSTPEGRLFLAMLGAFAQYFSDSLAKHTSKGMKERVMNGLPNGDVPFGYRRNIKDKIGEQDGHLYIVPEEAEAVKIIFQHYAGGGWSLSKLAAWLNEGKFHTRNKGQLTDGNGKTVTGPQPFSLYSVRWLLHNPFYTGQVRYHGTLYPGTHEAIISQEIFDRVQSQMKNAKCRSKTFSPRYRLYLLKGLVRCIYCGYPLWSETSSNGYSFYRESCRSHNDFNCPAHGKAISSKVVDEQMEKIIKSLTLDPAWRDRITEKLSKISERDSIFARRKQSEEKLKRLGRSYIDGVIDEGEYRVQLKAIQSALESLVVPGIEAAIHAGEFLEGLGSIWDIATMEEKHKLLSVCLDAVYVDIGASRAIVGLQPKPTFYHLFETLKQDHDSQVTVFHDPKKEKGPIQGMDPSMCMVETGES